MRQIASKTPGDGAQSLIHNQMVAGTRLLLSVAALVIISIDPTEPDRFVPVTYTALVVYCLFSLVLYLWERWKGETVISAWANPYWIDVVWYLLFAALSSGTSSIFFFFFYFAILNASFSRGFKAGLQVSVVSAASFTVVGYLFSTPDAFELDRFLLRPLSLLVLGYAIAVWGGSQRRMVKNLGLLRQIGSISNPRFGVDRTMGTNLDLLRRSFDADACMLIYRNNDGPSGEYHVRLCDEQDPTGGAIRKPMPRALGEKLMAIRDDEAVCYRVSGALWGKPKPYVIDQRKSTADGLVDGSYDRLAEALDVRSYLTCPMISRGDEASRLILYSEEPNKFGRSDLEFLMQAVDHFTPIIHNIDLVDRMASDAADEERRRIARDIHDSVIQPYIGLQMGLTSLATAMDSDTDDDGQLVLVKDRVERLVGLTADGLEDLRSYVHGLSTAGSRGSAFLTSLERYLTKFSAATGIRVVRDLPASIEMSDRLGAEIFQIVVEGLSNVRRHTSSDEAEVHISIRDDLVMVRISNAPDNEDTADFEPGSISGRTASLGGTIEVGRNVDRTTVTVTVPL
jgi:signal transduction histidine kinase